MKAVSHILILSALFMVSSLILAGTVNNASITNFVDSTPALAAEVNGNFTEHTTQINDNATSITTNASNITTNTSNITTNTNNITTNTGNITTNTNNITTNTGNITTNTNNITTNTGNISTNAADIVTLQTDVTGLQSGVYAVNPISFRDRNLQDTGCYVSSTGNFTQSAATTAGTNCFYMAPVQLPHNRTITGLSCTIIDNTTTSSAVAWLSRSVLSTGGGQQIFTTTTSVDSATDQVLSDTTVNAVLADKIDNSLYTYYVVINLSSTDTSALASNTFRINGCTISYN